MKSYLKYFRGMFIVIMVLLIFTGVIAGFRGLLRAASVGPRTNYEAPSQRVFDKADVLTDSEEQKLEALIAKTEKKIGCDIVIVTINESLYDQYGITYDSDYNWNYVMMNYADDFYDYHDYGYDKPRGDGCLLLDNCFEGDATHAREAGCYLSTCGKVYNKYTKTMVNEVIDHVNDAGSRYSGYVKYVKDIQRRMSGGGAFSGLGALINPFILIIGAIIAGIIFCTSKLAGKEGVRTTNARTYVEPGRAEFPNKQDILVNKFVTSRPIPRDTGGSSRGGSSHHGGYGGHTSHSGTHHGGGGGRR